MRAFARVTKLTNIGGRAGYISDPARQEDIVAQSDPVDWKPYQDYERTHQKTVAANNEGREVIVSLPNEWSELPHGELYARAHSIACVATGKETDMQWAVHWNEAKTNLHLHVVFSERQREVEAGKYDRDIYLTKEGKVARCKAERATDEDGKTKPPVHRKGEERGGFTAKDTRYKQKSWIHSMKEDLRKELARHGVEIEKEAALTQYHQGQGKESSRIAEKNMVIRENNGRLEALHQAGYPEQALVHTDRLKKRLGDKQTPVLYLKDGKAVRIKAFDSPDKAIDFLEQTKDSFAAAIDTLARPMPTATVEAAPIAPELEAEAAAPPHKQNTKTQQGSDLTRQTTSTAVKTPEIEPEAEIKPEAPKQKVPAVWLVEPVTEADDIATIDEKLEKIEQMQRERNKYNDAAKELGNDKYLAMVQERLAEIEKTNAELEKLKQANWAFDRRDLLGNKKAAEVKHLTAKKEKLITGLEQPMQSLKINLKRMNARIPIKALQSLIPPKEKAGDNIAVAKWLVSKVMGAIGALNNKAAVLGKPIPSIDTQIIWENIRKGKLKEQERTKKLEQGYEPHERPGREIGGRER